MANLDLAALRRSIAPVLVWVSLITAAWIAACGMGADDPTAAPVGSISDPATLAR
jgi:hypothetical protein